MAFLDNPLTIVQGAPTPSAEPLISSVDTTTPPIFQLPSGNWFEVRSSYAHGKPMIDKTTPISFSGSDLSQFRWCVKFNCRDFSKINAQAQLVFNDGLGDVRQFPTLTFRNPTKDIVSSATDFEDRNFSAETAKNLILENTWYYAVSTYNTTDKLLVVSLYDENGNIISAGAKTAYSLKNLTSGDMVLGGGYYAVNFAKSIDIAISECFIEKDGEVIWGETSGKTSNIGVFNFDNFDNFTEVEYIESDGTGQYIDTFFVPNNNTRFFLDCEINTTLNNRLLGSRYDSSTRRNTLAFNANTWYCDYGTNRQTFTQQIIGRCTIDKDKNVLKINGVTKATNAAQTFTCPKSGWLFAFSVASGTLSDYAKMKLYSAKIYDNGTLIRDFVPCYHTASGIIGLFDRVNNKFYSNAGSGDFIKGADIN